MEGETVLKGVNEIPALRELYVSVQKQLLKKFNFQKRVFVVFGHIQEVSLAGNVSTSYSWFLLSLVLKGIALDAFGLFGVKFYELVHPTVILVEFYHFFYVLEPVHQFLEVTAALTGSSCAEILGEGFENSQISSLRK